MCLNQKPLNDQIMKTSDILILNSLLKIIIPKSKDGKMPSASEIGFFEYIAQYDSYIIPEIIKHLKNINKLSQEKYKSEFIDLPEHEKDIIFKIISKTEKIFIDKILEKILDCYYTNDRVLVGLGLDPKPPFPVGNDIETGDLSLLNPVKQRGEIFRKA